MLLPNIDTLVVTIMEARNFITAREMLTDGNWILTTMNGEARYEKPPLPTWFTAISGMIFGAKSLFALRLPAALMVAFSGVFMYLFSFRLTKNKQQSVANGFILITSFYIIGITNEAPWDIFAHGFMLAGLFFLFRLFKEDTQVWKNALLASIFIGFSILSKGPVSLFAMFLPFLISYGIVFKFKGFKKKIAPFVSCIILFLIIGGWWFLYVRQVDGEAFIKIAEKETSRWGNYNVKPFYYYWSFFVQSGIWAILGLISLIYPYIIKRVANKKHYKFSFLWTIIGVTLLSCIPEKKSRYLVPVLFPLALNISFYIEYLFENFKYSHFKKNTLPAYFNFGLFALIGMSFPIIAYTVLKDNLDGLWIQFIIASLVLFSIGVLLLKHLKNKNIKKAFYTTIAFFGAILLFGLPLQKGLYSNVNFHHISHLKETVETDRNIKSYTFGDLTPELLWYYGEKIIDIKNGDSFSLPSDEQFGLLVSNKYKHLLKNLPETHSAELIGEFDMNYYKKKRARLIRNYYLVKKK